MYETLITTSVRPKYVTWDTPNLMTLDVGNGDGQKQYRLQKGAIDYLHSIIDVKTATSKDLFKKSPEMWKQFRDERLKEVRNGTTEASSFYLDKDTLAYLVTDSGDIADIVDLYDADKYAEFESKHQSLVCELTSSENVRKIVADGNGGLYKFICYNANKDIFKETYVPVVILELNNSKSTYKAYNGILMCTVPEDYDVDRTEYVVMPSISASLDEKSLSQFITLFSMKNMMEYSEEKAEELYNAYCTFKENPVEISAREMTSLCKSLGYKLELDDSDTLRPFENMADEDNKIKIQTFFDTFKFTTGDTAYDILQMSDLKRTFRYNKLTLIEVLAILSKEYVYCSTSKVTADILSDIVYKLFYIKNMDKIQSDDVKNEIV